MGINYSCIPKLLIYCDFHLNGSSIGENILMSEVNGKWLYLYKHIKAIVNNNDKIALVTTTVCRRASLSTQHVEP